MEENFRANSPPSIYLRRLQPAGDFLEEAISSLPNPHKYTMLTEDSRAFPSNPGLAKQHFLLASPECQVPWPWKLISFFQQLHHRGSLPVVESERVSSESDLRLKSQWGHLQVVTLNRLLQPSTLPVRNPDAPHKVVRVE